MPGSLLAHYVYPILIIGTFLEGETIMVPGDVKRYEIELIAAIAGIASLIWLVHFYKPRRSGHTT